MGADMIVYVLPECELTPEREQALRKMVAALPYDDQCDDDFFQTYDEWLEAMDDAIAIYRTAAQSREVTLLQLPGMQYVTMITGGLSWGDHPTEIAHYFEVLNRCDVVYQQLEKWAVEDCASKLIGVVNANN